MIAKNLISYYVPAVKSSSPGENALAIMDEHRISHLPVVDNGSYKGMISDELIFDMEDPFQPIDQQKATLIRPYVRVYHHLFTVMDRLADSRVTSIPVLDEKEEYVGLITIQDLAFQFANLTNANEPGGVLVLSMNIRDYSLGQIAQIVESENAKVLSSYVLSNEDSMAVDVVLKINKKDLSAIIKSFIRFEYEIKASFHESAYDEDLQDRYNLFMKYLNI